MIGTVFAFVILPAIGFGLLFGGIYYFIPYVVQNSGITLIYIFVTIVIIEIAIYIYMKFIRQETLDLNDLKDSDEFTFVRTYQPFLSHVFFIMYLGGLVSDYLVKLLPDSIFIIDYASIYVLTALAFSPILMAIYSIYFYWNSIIGIM